MTEKELEFKLILLDLVISSFLESTTIFYKDYVVCTYTCYPDGLHILTVHESLFYSELTKGYKVVEDTAIKYLKDINQ